MESLRHLFRRAPLVWRLRRLELLANYIVKTSAPTIIFFCVILKDVDNLYKWKTFRPKGLHQSQVLHADGFCICMQNLALMKTFEPKSLPFK